MGLVTLAQFHTRVASALGRAGDVDTTLITAWVNEAQNEFALAYKFTELEGTTTVDTVAGTDNYALPSDFRAFAEGGGKLLSPEAYTNAKFNFETRWQWRKNSKFVASANRATPTHLHKFGKRLYVRPVPDRVYTIAYDYWKLPTRLTADGHVSVFNEDWDEVIFRGALYRGHMHFSEHDRMVNSYNMFLALVRSKVLAQELEEFPEGGIHAVQNEEDLNQ